MADVQILRASSGAVPSNYVLPDAAELLLKAVYAEFTDNGAASNWLPCVTILSDSGDVIARAVDPGVEVTAGSDADVSFFPGVKHAAASSGGAANLPWAIVSITADDPGLAIGATNVPVPYDLTDFSDTFYMTNDPATFSFDSANHAHEVLVDGYYMIQTWTRCRLLGTANAGNFAKRVSSASLELSLATSMTSFLGGNWNVPGYIATNTFWDPNSIEYADYRGQNPKWQHIRSNTVGAALVGQRSTFSVIRMGDAKTTGTIP